ncbi:MAG: T9SS type A sorting domain-containing protein [Candidatus Marinimicrobia bacterium]|nr:T9SS type A sorting domain-containing protein [Candidatus Neomarinimicrobiota bacterium]
MVIGVNINWNLLTSRLVIFYCVLVAILSAQWPSSPDEPGVYIGTGSGGNYSISDNKGGFWISFLEYNNSLPFGLGLGIWHVDKFGYLSWNDPVYPFRMITSPDTLWLLTGGPIVNDGSGGVFTSYSLAIFNSINSDPLDFLETIYLQHIDSLGNKLWGEAGIQVTIPESFQYGISYWWIGESDLIYDQNGGVYILWTDWRHGTAPTIYGQHYNQYGVGLWDSTGSRLLYSDTNAVLTNGIKDGTGGIIFKVRPWNYPGKNIIQRVDPNSNLLWGDSGICISDSTHVWGWGALLSDNNGGAILVERLIRQNSDSTGSWYEYTYNINRIDNSGLFLWGIDGTSTGDYLKWATFKIYACSDGSFYYISGARSINRIDPSGVIQWQDNFVSSMRVLSLVESSDNSILTQCYYDNFQYFVQKVDSTGNLLWNGDSIKFQSGDFISDTRGGAICVNRADNRQISVNGNLGEVLLRVTGNHIPLPKTIEIYQNYPNPFNPLTTLSFYLPEISNVTLVIYDLRGREVTRVVDRQMNAGTHKQIWKGENSLGVPVSTGVYICRMVAASKESNQQFTQSLKMVLLK